jgi:hypothetical protein
VCGDATEAYGGKLKRCLRHVLFLRPGLFVVLDELEAPAPARFDWLLHAIEKMQVDETARTVTATRGGASLTVRLDCEAGLGFHLTDQFDTPYNEGNPPEYHEQRANQWHFKATTERPAAQVRIAAVMVVRGPAEKLDVDWKQHPGWSGAAMRTPDGSGEVWAQLAAGASPPPGVRVGARLFGTWRPVKAAAETLAVR